MSVKHDKQRLYASLLSVGAGFLLFRTFYMMFVDHAFELLVPWVSALLVAESILDLACLVGSIRWAITDDERKASPALRLCVAVIILHAIRVLIYVLGRTGPWINFDVKPVHHASYITNWFWVYFAGILSALSVVAVIVIWRIRMRAKKQNRLSN